jgi:hypothetical protein
MKETSILLLSLLLCLPAIAKGHSHGGGSGTGAKASRSHVSGYTKKNGTHVNPHNRSTKDETKSNNWSTEGNRNPETGKPGSK